MNSIYSLGGGINFFFHSEVWISEDEELKCNLSKIQDYFSTTSSSPPKSIILMDKLSSVQSFFFSSVHLNYL